MRNQKGYMELDHYLAIVAVGFIVIGALVPVVVSWVWGFLKPLIHTMTG